MKELKQKAISDKISGDSINRDELTITHYISTRTPDRYGDIMEPLGCDDSEYKKNPVVFFGHMSQNLPIAKNISLSYTDDGIIAVTKFDDSEFAKEIFRLNAEGFLNSWSIGYLPLERPIQKGGYNVYEKWQLLEYSSVPIPANPDAVNLLLKEVKNSELKKIIEKNFSKLNTNNMHDALETGNFEPVKKNNPLEDYKIKGSGISADSADFRQFVKSIAYNKPELMPERIKSNYLNEGVSADGGYLVPVEFYDKIMMNVFETSVIKRNATVINTEAKEIQIPKLSSASTFAFVNEGTAKPVSNPVFSQVRMVRKDGGFIVLLSKQLIEDSKFDLMNYLAKMAGSVISNAIDSAGFKGSSGVITGVLDSTFGATPIVAAGGTPNSIVYDDVLKCISAIPSQTLPNAKFYMHRSMLGYLRRLKNETGDYLISPDERKNLTLEGFKLELSDNMYSYSESALSRGYIAFGDLSTLFLHERKELQMSVSDSASVNIAGTQVNLWQQGLIGLNFNISFDIKAVFPENIAVIQTAAE